MEFSLTFVNILNFFSQWSREPKKYWYYTEVFKIYPSDLQKKIPFGAFKIYSPKRLKEVENVKIYFVIIFPIQISKISVRVNIFLVHLGSISDTARKRSLVVLSPPPWPNNRELKQDDAFNTT